MPVRQLRQPRPLTARTCTAPVPPIGLPVQRIPRRYLQPGRLSPAVDGPDGPLGLPLHGRRCAVLVRQPCLTSARAEQLQPQHHSYTNTPRASGPLGPKYLRSSLLSFFIILILFFLFLPADFPTDESPRRPHDHDNAPPAQRELRFKRRRQNPSLAPQIQERLQRVQATTHSMRRAPPSLHQLHHC